MRPTRNIAAMMLVAACAAGGCSKHDDKLQAKTPTSDSATTKPVGTAGEVENVKPPENAALTPAPAAEPMTFADGKASVEELDAAREAAAADARRLSQSFWFGDEGTSRDVWYAAAAATS